MNPTIFRGLTKFSSNGLLIGLVAALAALAACSSQGTRSDGRAAGEKKSRSLRIICDRLAQLVNTEGTAQIQLGSIPGHPLTANLEGAPDGSGTFKISNLLLRVYGEQDGGGNRCMDLTFEDRNGDGFEDLVVEGMFPGKNDKRIFDRVYLYVPGERIFLPADSGPTIPEVELHR